MMEFLAANFQSAHDHRWCNRVWRRDLGHLALPQTRRWLWWLRRGRLQWRLRRVQRMPLTEAHLRYLLAIYEVSQTHLDISSRSIAEKLGVTKPSVVRIMNLLMERGMIVKEHYGKIYMTDRGIFVAKEVQAQLERVLQNFPPVNIELTEEERFAAALALTSALPERAFVGEYEQPVRHGLRRSSRTGKGGLKTCKPMCIKKSQSHTRLALLAFYDSESVSSDRDTPQSSGGLPF